MTLPILLLLTLIALDFGRVYLGYINLQNMARIAANFAANNPDAWTVSGNPNVRAAYQSQIANDAKATNCSLPLVGGTPTAPIPTFSDTGGNGSASDVGDSAQVGLTCRFQVITPFISSILGGTISVSATSVFPIKTGMTGTQGGATSPPNPAFDATPTSGPDTLTVQFRDQSGGGPLSWLWDFGDGSTSTLQDPLHTYSGIGLYSVTLTVGNSGGTRSLLKPNYISVASPSVVDFAGTPTSGSAPLTVAFTDESSGSPTAWSWAFGDGATSTQQNPTHQYASAETYTVSLTVTNGGGTSSLTKANYISVTVGLCHVPDFTGTSTSNAQSLWNSRGFTTTVTYKQGNLPWTIKSQTITGNSDVPCSSTIQVSKN